MSSVLCIGGWEPAGVAGLAVDLRTASALGVHAAGVISALTAQGSGVHAVDITSDDLFAHQLDCAARISPRAIKVGMLGAARHVRQLVRWLEDCPEPLVYDPVLRASTGGVLMVADDVPLLRTLLPRVDLLTPNLDEAEQLCGLPAGALGRGGEGAAADAAIEDAARRLLELGARAVLIKGGHAAGAFAQDFFLTRAGESAWLSAPRVAGAGARGTGCALSTAIACAIAWGPARVLDLIDAIVVGKAYVRRGLRGATRLGDDQSLRVLLHAAWPVGAEDLPWITARADDGRRRLHALEADVIGFYPIVAQAAQVATLARAGVGAIQLRVKGEGQALQRELAAGVAAVRGTSCRLYINDFLDDAIALGAYGVHLGQEDLQRVGPAGVQRAIAAGLRIGISTHTYAELARALAIQPSYIALGPIYPTTLKSMRYPPQTPARLAEWKQLAALPLVAIGGITLARLPEVVIADGVSIVSDLFTGGDPVARALAYVAACSLAGARDAAPG